LRELHERAALMQFQPAARYRKLKAGGIFRGRGLVDEQKGAVELFDLDPAILNWFEGAGVF
jgi:hypothetical protein